ncbi:hypothetical protein BH24GEM2_BH24GEM2_19110 [soil metagenome]|jgi:hypothetical protein|nr:DUF4326 domain-containing protein [Gemmatimonadota bacterium]
MCKISVVNVYREADGAEYIGRQNARLGKAASPLANPFVLKEYGGKYTRDESVDAYREWLAEKIAARDAAVCDELNRLYGIAKTHGSLKLACFCSPQRCHGDVVKQVLLQKLG